MLMAGAGGAEDGAPPPAAATGPGAGVAGGPESADVALETGPAANPPASGDEPAGTSNPPGGTHE
jgi:hypothetical protein